MYPLFSPACILPIAAVVPLVNHTPRHSRPFGHEVLERHTSIELLSFALSKMAANVVVCPIPSTHNWQEPRCSTIKHMIREDTAIECAALRLTTHQLSRNLIPKIAHHCHTTAVATKRVVDTLITTYVRYPVERHSNIALPCMFEPHVVELRKHTCSHTVQPNRCRPRINLPQTRTSAE